MQQADVVLDPCSWSRSRNAMLWKAVSVISRAACATLAGTSASVRSENDQTRSAPGPLAGAAVRSVMATRMARQLVERAVSEQRWSVAVQPATDGLPSFDDVSTSKRTWIATAEGIADPCLVAVEGSTYLFVEQMGARAPASIAAARVADDGSISELRDVLRRPHHMSYPQVFEDAGSMWLLPETADVRAVTLFVAEEFPHRWREWATLIKDVQAFDRTLHRNADGYWLWVHVARHGTSRNGELWLFHSERLQGPWSPHPANPIVTDPRRSRPAGPIFMVNDRLVRPAQDGVLPTAIASCSTRSRSSTGSDIVSLRSGQLGQNGRPGSWQRTRSRAQAVGKR